MVARPHILLHRTRRRASGERFGREHVIEPPPDVALAHVAPRRTPCEEPIVVGIERAADVDETPAEDSLDDRAFIGALADRARLALLAVHVALRPPHGPGAHLRDRLPGAR